MLQGSTIWPRTYRSSGQISSIRLASATIDKRLSTGIGLADPRCLVTLTERCSEISCGEDQRLRFRSLHPRRRRHYPI